MTHDHHGHCDHCQPANAAPAVANDLEALKNEVSANLNNAHHKNLPWGSLIITAVLGILALVSVAQTAQTISIYSKIKSGDFKTSNTAVPATGQTQNLPDMVGGC